MSLKAFRNLRCLPSCTSSGRMLKAEIGLYTYIVVGRGRFGEAHNGSCASTATVTRDLQRRVTQVSMVPGVGTGGGR